MKLARVTWMAVTCAALALGQSKPEPKPAEQSQSKPQAAKPAAASAEKKANGKNEGIQVHGHWVLEIRNRDGSVASRKEFDNSLVPGAGNGGALLATILAGAANQYSTVGPWFVTFSNGNTPALGIAEGTGFSCGIPCSNSLTVSSSTGQLVLQGATPLATAATTITSVSTILILCVSISSPQACLQNPNGAVGPLNILTSHTFSAMTVQAGQDIAVTVTIGFS